MFTAIYFIEGVNIWWEILLEVIPSMVPGL